MQTRDGRGGGGGRARSKRQKYRNQYLPNNTVATLSMGNKAFISCGRMHLVVRDIELIIGVSTNRHTVAVCRRGHET